MRFAYADPPYIGKARKFYSADPRCAEVDHAQLVARLCDEYPDGWALSGSASTLRQVLAVCPPDVRVCPWTRKRPPPKPHVRVTHAWEPVYLRGGRDVPDVPHVYDWHASEGSHQQGLIGAKPLAFCEWVLNLLGYQDGDELVDLFPGTGIMGAVAMQGRIPA